MVKSDALKTAWQDLVQSQATLVKTVEMVVQRQAQTDERLARMDERLVRVEQALVGLGKVTQEILETVTQTKEAIGFHKPKK